MCVSSVAVLSAQEPPVASRPSVRVAASKKLRHSPALVGSAAIFDQSKTVEARVEAVMRMLSLETCLPEGMKYTPRPYGHPSQEGIKGRAPGNPL